MMGLPAGTRIWLAAGVTDMRAGMNGLAAKVQLTLAEEPLSGHVFVFRGRRGNVVKVLWATTDGVCLLIKRLERGRFVWPQADSGKVHLTQAQLSMLLEGINWVRRITDGRQRVKVPYDEEVANHIDPESCGYVREDIAEALTGAHVGQPLSDETLHNQSAHAIQLVEGNTSHRVFASGGRLCVVCRPWHAYTSSGREPRGLWSAPASRAEGRMVKAGSRRP
jgi:transposase